MEPPAPSLSRPETNSRTRAATLMSALTLSASHGLLPCCYSWPVSCSWAEPLSGAKSAMLRLPIPKKSHMGLATQTIQQGIKGFLPAMFNQATPATPLRSIKLVVRATQSKARHHQLCVVRTRAEVCSQNIGNLKGRLLMGRKRKFRKAKAEESERDI